MTKPSKSAVKACLSIQPQWSMIIVWCRSTIIHLLSFQRELGHDKGMFSISEIFASNMNSDFNKDRVGKSGLSSRTLITSRQ
jgi:hypothetical protein